MMKVRVTGTGSMCWTYTPLVFDELCEDGTLVLKYVVADVLHIYALMHCIIVLSFVIIVL